jgi:branched-chain amino acid transport system substrate-binding protein
MEMKEKVIVTIVFTMLLIGTMLTAFPIKAQPQIKIGIIGPVGLPHYSPAGMKEAAEMARDEINAAGGIHLGDGDYELVLVFGDEHAYPTPDPAAAALEVERLITVEGVEFIIGGFRSECTQPMIEMAMDYDIPFFICGSSTTELIWDNVPVDYERYKWLFRITPVNGSMLVGTIAGALQYYLPTKLLPLYGFSWGGPNPQVRIAVLTEDLLWSQQIHFIFTHPSYYPTYLGPYANVTYSARIPDGTTDCTSYLQDVIDSGARVLIHIFSGVTGPSLIAQWRAMNVSAIPFGINVMAQMQTYWAMTGGACKYETFLNYMGTRTATVPGRTDVFWDAFVAKTGVWPMYTAVGAYDGVNTIVEGLEAIGTNDKAALVTFLESYVRTTPVGSDFSRFDSGHDIYCNEYGPFWTQGFSRSMVVQWHAENAMEVISPVDKIYTKKWAIPPWMYSLTSDVNYDGDVNILDISAAAVAFGSEPGDTRWNLEADLDGNSQVNIIDIAKIALDFGKSVTLPLP